MTDIDKLIEAVNRLANISESNTDLRQKAEAEIMGHSRFTVGMTVANWRLSGFIESPEAMKIYSKSLSELGTRVLPFVVKGDWTKALKCHVAGIEEIMITLKGLNAQKDKDANKTSYG